MMKNYSTFIVTLALTFLMAGSCTSSNAGLFKGRGGASGNAANRHNGYSSPNVESSPYNRTGRPLTRLGQNRIARMHEQDARVASRTGKPVEEVTEKRVRRLEVFGAALGGTGAGLSATADAFDYSSPTINTFDSSPSLPSNFSQQMNWNSFNLNYSTNPSHASVY
jgi:hypothetical protein